MGEHSRPKKPTGRPVCLGRRRRGGNVRQVRGRARDGSCRALGAVLRALAFALCQVRDSRGF